MYRIINGIKTLCCFLFFHRASPLTSDCISDSFSFISQCSMISYHLFISVWLDRVLYFFMFYSAISSCHGFTLKPSKPSDILKKGMFESRSNTIKSDNLVLVYLTTITKQIRIAWWFQFWLLFFFTKFWEDVYKKKQVIFFEVIAIFQY